MSDTTIIFNSDGRAIALGSNTYQGPMPYALAPENFDLENWTNYILVASEVSVNVANSETGNTETVIQTIHSVELKIEKEFVYQKTQEWLDTFAQTKGYDNIISATSYINSSNTVYKQEAQYAIELRDLVWGKVFDVLANTEITLTSFSQVQNTFPVPTWPI